MKKQTGPRILLAVTFPLFIAAIIIGVIVFRDDIWKVFSSSETIRRTVDSWGLAAPLAFIGLQFFQVVIFIIPGQVPQIAGGYVFGMVWGTIYSVIGILLGSTFNFFLGRIFGVPFVRALFGETRLGKFKTIVNSPRAQIGFFLLFVIPGIPVDIVCYVAGLSSMRFPAFMLVSTIGRLPGIVGSAGIGGAAAASKWIVAGIIFAVASGLFILGVIFRERLQDIVERFVVKKPLDPDIGPGRDPDQLKDE